MMFIRSIFSMIFMFTVVPVHFVVSVVLMWFFPDPPLANQLMGRFVIRLPLWAAGVRFDVSGLDQLPTDSSYVVMVNHESMLDVVTFLMIMPIRVVFLAKRELKPIPFLGWTMYLQGQQFVNRQNPREAIRQLAECRKYLLQHRVAFMVFPEGTRSAEGTLLPFKRGTFKLALDTGLPIVPCAVSGASDIIPKHALLPRQSGTVRVQFGTPIDPATIAPDAPSFNERCDAASAEVRSKMEAMLG